MIYNYLELDDINKWPKDKKVLLLNLLGIKSPEELENIKVDTDYIMDVEARINNLFESTQKNIANETNSIYNGLNKRQKEVMVNIVDLMKERLEDDKDDEAYYTFKYLYHFLQSLETSKELKYILAYVAKATGFVKPLEFVFEENEQFIFESILFSAFTLYNGGGASKTKIAETHRRFVAQIEHKNEERMSRTLELNTIKVQALKNLDILKLMKKMLQKYLKKLLKFNQEKLDNKYYIL